MTSSIQASDSKRIFDDTPKGRSFARTEAFFTKSASIIEGNGSSAVDKVETNPTCLENLPDGHIPTLETVLAYVEDTSPIRSDREMDGKFVIEREEDGQLGWFFPGI